MSVSKINFNDKNEVYITIEPIDEINKDDFKNYLDLDSPSFLKCEFENDEAFKLYFDYGNRITLRQFLSRVVYKSEAVSLLKSLLTAYMEAEKHGLNVNNIPLAINSIFYNEESREVSCIYIPVWEDLLQAKPLRLFLKEVLMNAVYSMEDDMTWLGNTIRFIGRNRQFSYKDFYDFLQTQEELDEEPVLGTDITPEKKPEISSGKDTPKEEEAVQERKEEPAVNPTNETSLQQDRKNGSDDDLGALRSVLESIPAAESVNSLKYDLESSAQENDASKEVREAGVLLRHKDQAVYILDKPENSIGKASFNDICIDDNPAVSRVHAIVTRTEDSYEIRDNGSTNHIFVNGIVLTGDQRKSLRDGDRILLGNEEFVFKIQEI